eukprot:CFRG0840T1
MPSSLILKMRVLIFWTVVALQVIAVTAQNSKPPNFDDYPECPAASGSQNVGPPYRTEHQRGNTNITVVNQDCSNGQLLSIEYRTTEIAPNQRVYVKDIQYYCKNAASEICEDSTTVTINNFTTKTYTRQEIDPPGNSENVQVSNTALDAGGSGNCQWHTNLKITDFIGGTNDGKEIQLKSNTTTCTVPTGTQQTVDKTTTTTRPGSNRPQVSHEVSTVIKVTNPDGSVTVTTETVTKNTIKTQMVTTNTVPNRNDCGMRVANHRDYSCCSASSGYSCCNTKITNRTDTRLDGTLIKSDVRTENQCRRCGGALSRTQVDLNGLETTTVVTNTCFENSQTGCLTTVRNEQNHYPSGRFQNKTTKISGTTCPGVECPTTSTSLIIFKPDGSVDVDRTKDITTVKCSVRNSTGSFVTTTQTVTPPSGGSVVTTTSTTIINGVTTTTVTTTTFEGPIVTTSGKTTTVSRGSRTIVQIPTITQVTTNILPCSVTEWGEWSSCSLTCGEGTRTRNREITRSAGNGILCITPTLFEQGSCNLLSCPCVTGSWTPYGECSASCGNGIHTRQRPEITPAEANAPPCILEQTSTCQGTTCPVKCVGEWTQWTTCPLTCASGINKGTITRNLTIIVNPIPPNDPDTSCGALQETDQCVIPPCSVDCVVGSWSQWSSCSVTCGSGGQIIRSRVVVTPPSNGGAPCLPLSEVEPCFVPIACPANCSVSPWTNWSPCSATCGPGTQERNRTVDVPAVPPGTCVPLYEQGECQTEACPLGCIVSEWTGWSTCPVTCGGSVQTRNRTVIQEPEVPNVCPNLGETQECGSNLCPVDCMVSEWADWTDCSTECGGGMRYRQRTITVPASNGGTCFDPLDDSETCNNQPCPVDCEVGPWSAYTPCSVTCGPGDQFRTRNKTVEEANGGTCTYELGQIVFCNEDLCNKPCELSDWSAWSDCPVTCGLPSQTVQTATRTITALPSPNPAVVPGYACPAPADLTKSTPCIGVTYCPVDCQLGPWTLWGSCTQNCGYNGTSIRTRNVLTDPAYGGTPCGNTFEDRKCQSCNCEVGPWSSWDKCSQSCTPLDGANGFQTQTRPITQPALPGEQCIESLVNVRPCNPECCPVECETGSWGSWSACSVVCGGGTHYRTRQETLPALCKGPCTLDQVSACNGDMCPIKCEVGPWSSWSSCDITCLPSNQTGVRIATRTIVVPPYPPDTMDPALVCPPLNETTDCHGTTPPCPIDCQVSPWSTWSVCSTECGLGSQTRTRNVTQYNNAVGATCPTLTNDQDCTQAECPVPCVMGPWSNYGPCSATCGPGFQSRDRDILVNATGGGPCYPTTEVDSCLLTPCTHGCNVSEWSAWSPCSATCGGGTQVANRTITQQPTDGTSCPALGKSTDCNLNPCPVDCVLGPYGPYSECSVSCGGGIQTRVRPIITSPENGGAECGPVSQNQTCEAQPCPVDCTLNNWSSWSDCSVTCGNGNQVRNRTKATVETNNGSCIFSLSEQRECTEPLCEQPCEVTAWTDWSVCSATCGNATTATQTSTRTILATPVPNPPTDPNYACPSDAGLIRTTPCVDIQGCDIDCVLGPWTGWGLCTKYCGQTGGQIRTRDVVTITQFNGLPCSDTVEERNCTVCACEVEQWSEWTVCSVSCGGGIQTSHRDVIIPVAPGQTCNNTLDQDQACEVQACPIDCVPDQWSSWSLCSESCGDGLETRNREIIIPAENGGECITNQTSPCSGTSCPTACEVSNWSAWGTCDITCLNGNYDGTRQSTRVVTKEPFPPGTTDPALECPALIRTTDCSGIPLSPCPIDCIQSEWTIWTACSLTCNQGVQSRTRTILQYPNAEGTQCGSNIDSQNCNDGGCPPCIEGCNVTSWSEWTACSMSCGGGTQNRSRTEIIPELGIDNNDNCPPLNETQVCNDQLCPIDCVVGDWTTWGDCSTSCGNSGVKHRSREILTPPANGGSLCGSLSENIECPDTPCPVDCTVDQWSPWSACSITCDDNGTEFRTRKVVTEAQNNGSCLFALNETIECHGGTCEFPCVVSNWSSFSPCPVTCGPPSITIETSTRTILQTPIPNPPTNPLYACPKASDLIRYTPCIGVTECPQNCVLSLWSNWSLCTEVCGTSGQRLRQRNITIPESYGGAVCGDTVQTEPCNRFECGPPTYSCTNFNSSANCPNGYLPQPNPGAILCKTKCTATECCQRIPSLPSGCQTGTNIQETHCAEELVQVDPPIPVDFQGQPIADPFHNITNPQALLGCQAETEYSFGVHGCVTVKMPFPFATSITIYFYEPAFGSIEYKPYTKRFTLAVGTSPTSMLNLGESIQSNLLLYNIGVPDVTYQIMSIPDGCYEYINVCDTSSIATANDTDASMVANETATDNQTYVTVDDNWISIAMIQSTTSCACKIDCVVSEWTAWSDCPLNCGENGVQGRFRYPETLPKFGGAQCIDTLNEIQQCYRAPCAIDCMVTNWSEWTNCSTTCDAGIFNRTRSIIRTPADGGTACPELIMIDGCNEEPQYSCGFNSTTGCTVSDWSEWYSCSAPCDGGIHIADRFIVKALNTSECPGLTKTEECNPANTVPCTGVCVLGDWSPWSTCSEQCGKEGTYSRSRPIVIPPSSGFPVCDPTYETAVCQDRTCSVYTGTKMPTLPSTSLPPYNNFNQTTCPEPPNCVDTVIPSGTTETDNLIVQFASEILQAGSGIKPYSSPFNVLNNTTPWLIMNPGQVVSYKMEYSFWGGITLNLIFTWSEITGNVEVSRDGICWVPLGGFSSSVQTVEGQAIPLQVPNGCYSYVRITDTNYSLNETVMIRSISSQYFCDQCPGPQPSPSPEITASPSPQISASHSPQISASHSPQISASSSPDAPEASETLDMSWWDGPERSKHKKKSHKKKTKQYHSDHKSKDDSDTSNEYDDDDHRYHDNDDGNNDDYSDNDDDTKGRYGNLIFDSLSDFSYLATKGEGYDIDGFDPSGITKTNLVKIYNKDDEYIPSL